MDNYTRKIILVDDDEDDRDLFAEALASLNLKADLVQFKNGHEFLNYIKKVDKSLNIHVFLDLNMPIISGIEVLKQLRKTLKLEHILVTIYSTSSSPNDVENAYTYGAIGYLRKPSCFNELQKMIYKAIKLSLLHNGKQVAKEHFVLS